MKRKIIYLSVLSVFLLSLFSCEQDELQYSCDENINAWVKNNLSDIEIVEWDELSQMELEYQRAAFKALNANQRQGFWVEKIKETANLDWDKKEKAHIGFLLTEILSNSHWFIPDYFKDNQDEYDKFLIFFYKWIEYGKEKLNWNDNIIHSIIGTLKAPSMKDETDVSTVDTDIIRLKSDTEKNCNCNTKLGNSYNECNSNFKHCSTQKNCIVGSWGCAALFLGKCTGLCADN